MAISFAQRRKKRQHRVRARVQGTAARPRLNVFRSLRGFSIQIIDDASRKTLASVHSKTAIPNGAAADLGGRAGKTAVAYVLGKAIAEKAVGLGITTVVFDRAGYAYHGRVRAAAEGAREGGLIF